jgi:hypothetical protein
MRGAIPPLPNTPSWRGAQLKKHRDGFIGTFRVQVMKLLIQFSPAFLYFFSDGSKYYPQLPVLEFHTHTGKVIV